MKALLPCLLATSIATEKAKAVTLKPQEAFGIFCFLFIWFWNFMVMYLYLSFLKKSFVETWWAFQSGGILRLVQLWQVSQENKYLFYIRCGWRSLASHPVKDMLCVTVILLHLPEGLMFPMPLLLRDSEETNPLVAHCYHHILTVRL